MGARILVADDSVTIQKVVELTFSREDFVLVQARSGEEAIRKAKEVRPDLVLLDLVMPDRNGYEVCAALRADPTLHAVPIILLAGTFEPFDKDKGFRAGANDFITKPFESQALIGKVKQLLVAKAAPAEAPHPAPPAPPPPRPSVPPSKPTTEATLVLDVGSMFLAPPPPAPPSPPRPAPAPPPVVTHAPGPVADQPPKLEEISQDQLWDLLESTPVPISPAAPGTLGELSLEALTPPPGMGAPTGLSLEELPLSPAPTPIPPPTTGPPAGPGGLSLEEISVGPAPAPVAMPSLDLPPGPVEAAAAGPPAAPPMEPAPVETGQAFVVPAPERLSLDELLTAPPTSVSPEAGIGPVAAEEAPVPVYDLTPGLEAPPLPLVEVGTGPPPPFPMVELLRPTETAPSPAGEAGPVGVSEVLEGPVAAEEAPVPVYDLTPGLEAPPPPVVEVQADVPPPLPPEDVRLPTEADLFPGSPIATPVAPEIGAEAVPETPSELLEVAAQPAGPAAPLVSEPPGVTPWAEAVAAPPEVAPPEVVLPSEPAAAAPSIAPPEPPVAAAPPVMVVAPPEARETPAPPGPPVSPAVPEGMMVAPALEVATLRQAVTDRVAQELAREVSEKLVKRIEEIVWEVVPDLAEILITREIERIRAAAEGKDLS